MTKKPKIGEMVNFPGSNNNTGIGIVVDPATFNVPRKDKFFMERENYVLIQSLIDNVPSTIFWIKYKELKAI